MEIKRFKSMSGEEVRIARIDGHVAIIGTEWTDLHPRFHSDAYAAGCISEDMIRNAPTDVDPKVVNTLNNIALQKNEVESAIIQLVKDNDLEAFDTKGKPKSSILTKMVNFRVTNAMRDEIWYKVQEQGNDTT